MGTTDAKFTPYINSVTLRGPLFVLKSDLLLQICRFLWFV